MQRGGFSLNDIPKDLYDKYILWTDGNIKIVILC